MKLLYFALLSEAQIFIEKLGAKKVSSNPKVFISKCDEWIIAVGGVGGERVESTLEVVFKKYRVVKAVNIGIAGVNSKDISIGTLFCVHPKKDIELITRDLPTTSTLISKSKSKKERPYFSKPKLFDMEGEYFYRFCRDRVDNLFIFKVVSDHLDSKIPSKEFVKRVIYSSFNQIMKAIE